MALMLSSLLLVVSFPVILSFKAVPQLPPAFEKSGNNSAADMFISLWHYTLEDLRKIYPNESAVAAPKAIVAPNNDANLHWAPADAPDPMYSLTEDNVKMRIDILRDYLLLEDVDPSDKKLTKPGGYNARNSNNRTVNFFMNNMGELWVENMTVQEVINVDGGGHIYVIDLYLFDHYDRVTKAVETTPLEESDYPESPFAVALPDE